MSFFFMLNYRYNLKMETVVVYAPALDHTKLNHPEGRYRLEDLWRSLDEHGVLAELTAVSPQQATVAQLNQVHSLNLINHIQRVSQNGGGLLDGGDTYATPLSYDLARLAAGSAITAVDQIMTGQAKNGFALIRPPGHHAERERISGFCLFNNVAAAARQAQVVHGAKRVLIFDFDVHHGNGTQDIFYDDDSVMFISTHLFIPRMFYPGTGNQQELGNSLGHGFTLNVPLLPNVGDVGYGRILTELIRPKAKAFQPDLILVSAGYDAHWQDPLAMAGLSLTGYAQISRALVTLADELTNGRILFVLEGGYQPEALTYGILNTFYALIGQDKILDPLGLTPHSEQDISHLLHQLKQRHLIY
ncbi:histone deacetylase family protein [hydrothermal vent metagenome]|uniref:Histone deacetylase family protein n=1 Tax=hydrothermal vent metagenome TaxID=652676 RepID=A0A3B0UL10_9ZZZZ